MKRQLIQGLKESKRIRVRPRITVQSRHFLLLLPQSFSDGRVKFLRSESRGKFDLQGISSRRSFVLVEQMFRVYSMVSPTATTCFNIS